MKLVLVESPFMARHPDPAEARLGLLRNLTYARLALRDCVRRGESPLASHLLLTQPLVLNDDVAAERELGIDAGLAWGAKADCSAFYVDLGFSNGMQRGLDAAAAGNREVEVRRLPGWEQSPSETAGQTLARLKIYTAEALNGYARQGGAFGPAPSDHGFDHDETGILGRGRTAEEAGAAAKMVLYEIRNSVDGKRYFGITSRVLMKRQSEHVLFSKTGQTKLARAMRKYGVEAFTIRGLLFGASFQQLQQLEQAFVRAFNTQDDRFGYNMTDGGDGTVGRRTSDLTKERIREGLAAVRAARPELATEASEKARAFWSTPAAKAQQSARHKGKVISEKHRQQISEALTGRPRSAEHRANLAHAMTGKSRPQEVRDKISASSKGKRMPDGFGKKMSEIHKGRPISEAARESRRRYWARRRSESDATASTADEHQDSASSTSKLPTR